MTVSEQTIRLDGRQSSDVDGDPLAFAWSVTAVPEDGKWELAELISLVPAQLLSGVQNPAPPPPDLDIPGRPAP